ncbi:hypothetical protein MASR1M12_39350 [Erysipelotrichia bacterium]
MDRPGRQVLEELQKQRSKQPWVEQEPAKCFLKLRQARTKPAKTEKAVRKRVSAHCQELGPEKAGRQGALFEAGLFGPLMALVATPVAQMHFQAVHLAVAIQARLLA